LAIECDGDAWHSNPDKKAKDEYRDAQLARYGWTTIRFSETELKEQKPEVEKTVASLIIKLWKSAVEAQEKQKGAGKAASIHSVTKMAAALSSDDFEFMDLVSRSYVVSFVSPPLGIIPFLSTYAQMEPETTATAEVQQPETEEKEKDDGNPD
jgi:hypothetical protein